MDLIMRFERRPAIARLTRWQCNTYNVEQDDTLCGAEANVLVHGLYPVGNNEDGIGPMFICEMLDGNVIYVEPENIRFLQEV